MKQKETPVNALATLIAEECIAVRLRMLTRAVTKLYNKALRPHGLTVSQMNVLVAVSHLGQAKQQTICQALHLDKSTLSRDLTRMRMQGWIEEISGGDGRTTTLSVTSTGSKLLEEAFPAWQRAQAQARTLLGEQTISSFKNTARTIQTKDPS